jgi:hypothetical protein
MQAIGTIVVTHDDKPVMRDAPRLEFARDALVQIASSLVRDALKIPPIHPAWDQPWQQTIEQNLHG